MSNQSVTKEKESLEQTENQINIQKEQNNELLSKKWLKLETSQKNQK